MSAARWLAVSNLAWPDAALEEALELLVAAGAYGVEVAPTRIAAWDQLDAGRLCAYRDRLAVHDLVPSSLQAIFFGAADAQLLGDVKGLEAMATHLRLVGMVGKALGVSVAVFGAPRNRNRVALGPEAAMDLAEVRLRWLAPIAAENNLVLAMEPVPSVYNSDFLQTWQEVLGLVERVGHPAVRLHLDTSCVALGGGDLAAAVEEGHSLLAHFHAAQPKLGDFAAPLVDHALAGAALTKVGYAGWVAIEMLEQKDWRKALRQAIAAVVADYGSTGGRSSISTPTDNVSYLIA